MIEDMVMQISGKVLRCICDGQSCVGGALRKLYVETLKCHGKASVFVGKFGKYAGTELLLNEIHLTGRSSSTSRLVLSRDDLASPPQACV